MDRLTFGISILQSLRWKRDHSTAAASAVPCKGALVRAVGWGCSLVHGAQWPAPKAEGSWLAPTDTITPLSSPPASSAGEKCTSSFISQFYLIRKRKTTRDQESRASAAEQYRNNLYHGRK